ncbi:MAG: hypothetical protein WB555_00350 [Candidatus Korobacteraceae bacterium]
MNDATMLWIVTVVSAVVVLYLFWRQQHEQRDCKCKCDREDMLREFRRDLDQQERKMLSSFLELQRRLDQQHRILNYVSRRLS